MSSRSDIHGPEHAERVALHVLRALPSSEIAAVDAHLSECAECRREMEALRPVVESFAAWPTDILRPTDALWDQVARNIARESGKEPSKGPEPEWTEPAWKQAAPGLYYQLLATDEASGLCSMLVRLDPGCDYPPHEHAGVEELHLLDGELWIEQNKLRPGDYNRAEPGTRDHRVWSETGCTCVLITSHRDVLG